MMSVKIKSSSSVNVSRTQPSGAGLTRELLTKKRKEITKNCVKQRCSVVVVDDDSVTGIIS